MIRVDIRGTLMFKLSYSAIFCCNEPLSLHLYPSDLLISNNIFPITLQISKGRHQIACGDQTNYIWRIHQRTFQGSDYRFALDPIEDLC